jgi:hypothetical protein
VQGYWAKKSEAQQHEGEYGRREADNVSMSQVLVLDIPLVESRGAHGMGRRYLW